MTWTKGEDEGIRTGRRERLSWAAIGVKIHRHPGDVRVHAVTDLGLAATLPTDLKMDRENILSRARHAARAASDGLSDAVDADRPIRRGMEALPSGHPTTWGSICAEPYPTYSLPVPSR